MTEEELIIERLRRVSAEEIDILYRDYFLYKFDWRPYRPTIFTDFVGPNDLNRKKEIFLNKYGWTYKEFMKYCR